MDEFTRIATLDNQVEAALLDAALTEQNIPHIVRTYHDAALDGLFQIQKGWGCIEAATSQKAVILDILEDIRRQPEAQEGPLA